MIKQTVNVSLLSICIKCCGEVGMVFLFGIHFKTGMRSLMQFINLSTYNFEKQYFYTVIDFLSIYQESGSREM